MQEHKGKLSGAQRLVCSSARPVTTMDTIGGMNAVTCKDGAGRYGLFVWADRVSLSITACVGHRHGDLSRHSAIEM